MSAMFEAPKRRREPNLTPPIPESLSALSPETLKLLRDLAVASLMMLGVHDSERFIESEMTSKFSKLTAAVSGADDPEMELRAAIRHALDELDESE
jgi:hypothetical protein